MPADDAGGVGEVVLAWGLLGDAGAKLKAGDFDAAAGADVVVDPNENAGTLAGFSGCEEGAANAAVA